MKGVLSKTISISLLLFIWGCGETTKVATTKSLTPNLSETTLDGAKKQESKEGTDTFTNCKSGPLEVYLNDADLTGTNIRNAPGGSIITALIVDDQNSAYYFMVSEEVNGWFKISSPIYGVETDIQIPDKNVWIHSSVLGTDTRNYSGEHLPLLDKPKNGNVVATITNETLGLGIKEMCGDWVLVKYKSVEGWIERKWLCGNPLTTCN